MLTRIAIGREGVVREIRAAAPLAARLRVPVPVRGPWLTAALNDAAARRSRVRPVAVVVESSPQDRPAAVAFLEVGRRGLLTTVGILGSRVSPLPGGRPTAGLLAGDPEAAGLLADGVLDLLATLRRPWTLRLAGLPLGNPTVRSLAASLPTALLANERSARLVDGLDGVGAVTRSREPAVLERWLPALLAAAAPSSRRFLRAAARLHAAIGQLELAVVTEGDSLRAGLLTFVDGDDRWPWWGTTSMGGLGTEMGAPLVGLTVPARSWPR